MTSKFKHFCRNMTRRVRPYGRLNADICLRSARNMAASGPSMRQQNARANHFGRALLINLAEFMQSIIILT